MKFTAIMYCLFFLPSLLVHDLHISNCEIEYKEEDTTLQISLRIFIDDLELALVNRGAEDLFLCTKREHTEAEVYILDYLHDMVKLEVDGQTIEYDYIGKEMSDDLAAVWCYLEIENIDINTSMTIENRILMDLYDDQRNIVKVKLSKTKKEHFLFDPSDYKGEIQL